MKKKIFIFGFCIVMILMIVLGSVGASAATTYKSGSYVLSKTSQTEKKYTDTTVVTGGGRAKITAQHWKGSTFPTYSDTAYSKINESSGISANTLSVYIYKKNGALAANGSGSHYINVEAGYGVSVGSIKHIFSMSTTSSTLVYTVVGTQS